MKGIAVEQMIMLALGVIVLALVGYLLYSNYLSTSGTVSNEQCRTSLINACNNCKLANSPKGTWDTTIYATLDVTGSDGKVHQCGKMTNACADALDRSGAISVGQTPNYKTDVYDSEAQLFAQSVCTSVGVS